jgi:hypothetical protein
MAQLEMARLWKALAATTAMTHIVIQEHLDGNAVEWMEKVSDEQYQGHSQDNNRYD